MFKLNLKIGAKIGIIMGVFVVLSVSMALMGRMIISKFQTAASSHIPILNFYEEFLSRSRNEVLKFAFYNAYTDTLVVQRDEMDFQILLAYHKIKEMKTNFKEEGQEVNFDYKV
jgi:uncharacterized protein YpmB